MPDERSRLILPSVSITPTTHTEDERPPHSLLKQAATELIERYKSVQLSASVNLTSSLPVTAITTTPLEPTSKSLAIHLFALSILDNSSPKTTTITIRSSLRDATIKHKIHAALSGEVQRILDSFAAINDDPANPPAGEQNEDDGQEEEDDETLMDMLWGLWWVSNSSAKRVCAVQLMLPPYTVLPSPFLSHPLIQSAVDTAWSGGLSSLGPKAVTSILSRMRKALTPRRVHVLRFISSLILYGLTVYQAVKPGAWIMPYTTTPENPVHIRPVDVVWFIWAAATCIECVETPISSSALLHLPMTICILLSLSSLLNPILVSTSTSISTAYTFLNLSIPLLTLIFVLPLPPSIPFLFPSILLAPSVGVGVLLVNCWRPCVLLMPVLLAVGMIFTWSMNGDIWRLLLSFTEIASQPLSSLTLGKAESGDGATNVTVAGPIDITKLSSPSPGLLYPGEKGIAPFETRLTLFITFILLLIFLLMMLSTPTPNPITRQDPNSQWESQNHPFRPGYEELRYGRTFIHRKGRQILTQALVSSADSYSTSDHLVGGQRLDDGETRESPPNSTTTRDIDIKKCRLQLRYNLPPPLGLVMIPIQSYLVLLRLLTTFQRGRSEGKSDSVRLTIHSHTVERFQQSITAILLGPVCVFLATVEDIIGC